MNRLTQRIPQGIALCNKSIHCKEDCGCCVYLAKIIEKLAQYEEAEEQGLLFKMPCIPGDTIYILDAPLETIECFKVSRITMGKFHDSIIMTDKSIFTIWGKKWDEYFNRFVYPTKEAAEQALKKFQEETNNE